MDASFAIWITGLPASGKSTLAGALDGQLRLLGVEAQILESDRLRPVLTPQPTYSESEREHFYRLLGFIGGLLVQNGVPVIFDATANRQSYRDGARQQIERFLEVYVDCPLQVCMERDPKGIYASARCGTATTVPGLQSSYEEPPQPDIYFRGDHDAPERGAARIIAELNKRKWI